MKFKVSLSIGYVNATKEDVIEIDDEDIPADPGERELFLHAAWSEWAWNYIDGWIEAVDGT